MTHKPIDNLTVNSSELRQKTKLTSSPSFVKLAMKNMVRKGSQSLLHFALTAVGFIGFITVIAWFARPHLPS